MSFVKVNLSFSRTWNTFLPKSWICLELPFLWQNHHCSCPCSWRASQCATPRPWTRQTWASGRNRGPSFWRSLQPRPWDCFLYFLFRVSLLHAIFSLLQRDSFCTNWIGEYTTGGWFEHEAMNKITISGTAKLLNCFWFYCKTSPPQELSYLDITKLTRTGPNLFDHFLVSLSSYYNYNNILFFCGKSWPNCVQVGGGIQVMSKRRLSQLKEHRNWPLALKLQLYHF